MESSKSGLFAESVHLECCTEVLVRLFVACFICTWSANSLVLLVLYNFLYCITQIC